MCILRNVSKDKGLVEAVRLNNSCLMLDMSYYFLYKWLHLYHFCFKSNVRSNSINMQFSSS